MNQFTKRPNASRFLQRRGAALIEMAMVLTLLTLLTFGGVEFSDVYYKKNTLQGAAREGARAAIVSNATKPSVELAVTNVLNAAGIKSGYTIVITNLNDATVDPATVTVGTAIKVRVHGKWKDIGVSPLGIMNKDNVVNGTAVMRKES